MVTAIVLLTAFFVQQSTDQAAAKCRRTSRPGLGTCAVDFVVKDGDGKPVYQATIHSKIRYGAFSVKRMDVEINTNDEGKARIEGLPTKAKPIVYDIEKAGVKTTAQQDVATGCLASLQVTLK
jgi:hypothetical protein